MPGGKDPLAWNSCQQDVLGRIGRGCIDCNEADAEMMEITICGSDVALALHDLAFNAGGDTGVEKTKGAEGLLRKDPSGLLRSGAQWAEHQRRLIRPAFGW